MAKRKTKRIRIHIDGHTYLITPAQLLMYTHLRELKMKPKLEQKFWSERDWRLDIFCPEQRIAIECNGGKWSGGHRRGDAVDDENEKLNRAQMMGIRVLQFTNEYILEGKAKKFMKEYL